MHNTFRANGFPTKTIKPILEDPKYQQQTTPVEQSPDEIGPEDAEPKRTLCLPYVKGLSEKIDKVCRTIKSVKIRTVFKTVKTLRRTLMRVKNMVPEEKKKGVVYEIPCKDCSQTYVGETGRTLKKRISEHKQAVRRLDSNNGIAVHVQLQDHRIDWEGACVIENEQRYWRRRVLEAIHIQTRPHSMNLDCGLHLSGFWNSTLAPPT